jgi:RecB family exonuclease
VEKPSLIRGSVKPLLDDAAAWLGARENFSPVPVVPTLGVAGALARINPRAAAGSLLLRDLATRLTAGRRQLDGAGALLLLRESCPDPALANLWGTQLLSLINRIRLYGAPPLPGERGDALVAWAKRFGARLEKEDLLDEKRLYDLAAAAAPESPAVVMVGFYDLNPAQWRFVHALLRAGKLARFYHPIASGDEKHENFRAADTPWLRELQAEMVVRSIDAPPPQQRRWVSHADLATAARCIASCGDLASAAQALPDWTVETRASLAAAFAGSAAGSIALPGIKGWALPLGDAVAALLDLPGEDFHPDVLARFATGPHAREGVAGAALVRALKEARAFSRVRVEAVWPRDEKYAGFRALLELPKDDQVALPLGEACAIVQRLIESLLIIPDKESPAAAFAKQLLEALHGLSHRAEKVNWREFGLLLETAAGGDVMLDPPAPQAAIRAGTFRQLRLQPLKKLVLLDLCEGAWRIALPAIPREWLEPLGYGNLADVARLRLALLASQAEEITFVTFRGRGEDPAYPHPFFLSTLAEQHGLELAIKAAREPHAHPEMIHFIPAEMARPAEPLSPRAAWILRRQRLRRFGTGGEATGAHDRELDVTISASLLDLWGSCPFKACARARGIREQPDDDESAAADAAGVGNFLHAVLHDFFAGVEEPEWNGGFDEPARARLERALKRNRHTLEKSLPPGYPLVGETLRGRLRRWLEDYLAEESRRLGGKAPEGLYEWNLPEGLPILRGDFPYTGRADRIELSPRRLLIDYKSGPARQFPRKELPLLGRWQAPLYLAAARAAKKEVTRLEFHTLPDGQRLGIDWDDPALQLAVSHLPEAARALREEPLTPFPEAACVFCELEDACGKRWRDKEAWQAVQSGFPHGVMREEFRMQADEIKAANKADKAAISKGGFDETKIQNKIRVKAAAKSAEKKPRGKK